MLACMCVEEDHQPIRCVTLLVTYPVIECILGVESRARNGLPYSASLLERASSSTVLPLWIAVIFSCSLLSARQAMHTPLLVFSSSPDYMSHRLTPTHDRKSATRCANLIELLPPLKMLS